MNTNNIHSKTANINSKLTQDEYSFETSKLLKGYISETLYCWDDFKFTTLCYYTYAVR